MKTIRIPDTTLDVSSICLGTGEIGTTVAGEDAFALLDSYLEQGGNFLDTAHNYGDWVKDAPRSASEKTIGAWMRSRGNRDKIILATKGAHWNFDAPDVPRLSRGDIEADLNGSLESLGTDCIDLYWLHRDDPNRPVEDILETLNDQVTAGKIRYFGDSNWKTERLRAAQNHDGKAGLHGFVADQVLWNAAVLAGPPYGDPTTGWMDEKRYAYHLETGLAMLAYQSQAFGLFQRMQAGTLDQMNPGFRGFYVQGATEQRYRVMTQIMAETGLTITQVLLGYLLSQPFVTIPIVGCHSLPQLKDSLTAADVRLTTTQVTAITEAGGPGYQPAL
ncbi:MAG: aldo/keto reductase [Armatimonadota bacterium]|nr:aldo/keto reductase [Armatimonadota bacterium]